MYGTTPFPVRLTAALAAALVTGAICLGGEAAAPVTPLPAVGPVSFQTLRERARALAAQDYRPEPKKLPEALKKLGYDDYLGIGFRPEQGPWHKEQLEFTLGFFHPGYLYQDPVLIHLVEEGQVAGLRFLASAVRLWPGPIPRAIAAGHSLRRPARALSGQPSAQAGRSRLVPWRQLLPRAGCPAALRSFFPRAGHRHR